MSVLSSVLLRRLSTVYVDQPGPRPGDPSTAEGLAALEAELLDRGFAVTAPLYVVLSWLGPTGLAAAGQQLIRQIDAQLGADRTHMPLFRSFPVSVPDHTFQLFVDRVFTLLLQWPAQPCVLCATVATVHPVSPCAHLVCRQCWDGGDYSACPICHRHIDPADPFLRPAHTSDGTSDADRGGDSAGPLRLLTLGVDQQADTATALAQLLTRRTPLPPQDRDDVKILLTHAPAALDWLPGDIPVRATKALVLGALLIDPRTRATVRPLLDTWLTTATDVLRLLSVWSGGEADLLEPRRFRSLPRSLRRQLLAVLDGLDTPALVEDVRRHPELWKHAAEILHPFEQHTRHPRAALAFAVLRGTDTSDPRIGPELLRTAAAHPTAVRVDGTRLKAATWAGRTEEALRAKDLSAAIALLAQRPGELMRRLDHLLSLHAAPELPDEVADVLVRALPKAGPAPLLAALGRLRIRHLPGERRVFFPRGQVTHSFATDDTRAPLSGTVTDRVCELLEQEIVRRLSGAAPYDVAVLDSGLAHLNVPSAERASVKALVTMPRGSSQPLPEGGILRLFLHWTQPARTRVDLDLSVALFDANWTYTGLCDYTNLVYGQRAAVHSGDLTDAPAPDGATEYVDLDLDGLAGAGVRFAMPIIFSFNDVSFDQLIDAFAGFMALSATARRDSSYDPRTVRQRYDLTGDSRIHVPMVVDLEHRTFLWTDVHLPAAEGFHSVHRHSSDLGRIGRDLFQYFTAGRTTLWDLSVWHAAARTEDVTVIHPSSRRGAPDEAWSYTRHPSESTWHFADRIRRLCPPQTRTTDQDAAAVASGRADNRRVFLALVDSPVTPERATGTVYRLIPGAVDGSGLQLIGADDLLTDLKPERN